MENLFCNRCDNFLNTRIEKTVVTQEIIEEGKATEITEVLSDLIYFCEKCDYSEKRDTGSSSVYHLNYNLDKIKRNHIVNKYTALDITLPKATGIKCPNEKCPSKNTAKKSEIRYIKYDDKNMKYIYICIACYKAKIEPNIW